MFASLSKVFSLIVQEERQCTLGVRPMAPVDIVAFNSTGSSSVCASISSKNKRPICSHCNIVGHTVDKCYKMHEYPPGYKSQMNTTGSKPSSSSQSANVNQVSVD